MFLKLYLVFVLVVSISFYSFFSMLHSIEVQTESIAETIRTEVGTQSRNYLKEGIRKRVNPNFGNSRSMRSASSALPLKQLNSPEPEYPEGSAKDLIEDRTGFPTLSIEDTPPLDENEPTLDPQENSSSFTQEQLDRYIGRLETIQQTPSEYLRKSLLTRFKKEMEEELKINHANTTAQWLLDEIDAELNYLTSRASTPSIP